MKRNKPLVVAIIQARVGSTRLPAKATADILGKPLLTRIIQRIKQSHTIDDILVATTTLPEDNEIIRLAEENGVKSMTGSINDLLDRFYQAASLGKAEVIVRITGDDPFKDPEILDSIVNKIVDNPGLDYISNTIKPTFPEGLDIEVFRYRALEKAWKEARLPSEREHVTPFIWKNPDKFNIENFENEHDLSAYRWTVDYPEDLQFARDIYAYFQGKDIFFMRDILNCLKINPHLIKKTSGIPRNEGYRKSLNDDKKNIP
jgi:spore coat polysaccharide biosynthesis protein SpsF